MITTDMLTELGLKLVQERGDEIVARCPMHKKRVGVIDTNPSWSINKKTAVHHCWSCDYSGSLLTLVLEVRDTDVWDAKRFVRKFGVDVDALLQQIRAQTDVSPAEKQDDKIPRIYDTFEREIPSEWLWKRGLTQRTCEAWGIRWFPERTAWVLPWIHTNGALVGWQEKGEDNRKWFKNYPPNWRKSHYLFGLNKVGEHHSGVTVLVESPLDAVLLWQRGYDACAIGGVSLSVKQQKLLVERLTTELVVALDNDEDGRKSSYLMRLPMAKRVPLSFFNYAGMKGKDPGDLEIAEVVQGIQRRISFLEYA